MLRMGRGWIEDERMVDGQRVGVADRLKMDGGWKGLMGDGYMDEQMMYGRWVEYLLIEGRMEDGWKIDSMNGILTEYGRRRGWCTAKMVAWKPGKQ